MNLDTTSSHPPPPMATHPKTPTRSRGFSRIIDSLLRYGPKSPMLKSKASHASSSSAESTFSRSARPSISTLASSVHSPPSTPTDYCMIIGPTSSTPKPTEVEAAPRTSVTRSKSASFMSLTYKTLRARSSRSSLRATPSTSPSVQTAEQGQKGLIRAASVGNLITLSLASPHPPPSAYHLSRPILKTSTSSSSLNQLNNVTPRPISILPASLPPPPREPMTPLSPSPYAMNSSFSGSNSSLLSLETSQAEKRQTKMDKVQRTLGGDIPPELLFPGMGTELMLEFRPIPSTVSLAEKEREKEAQVKSQKMARRATISSATMKAFAPLLPSKPSSNKDSSSKKSGMLSVPPTSQGSFRLNLDMASPFSTVGRRSSTDAQMLGLVSSRSSDTHSVTRSRSGRSPTPTSSENGHHTSSAPLSRMGSTHRHVTSPFFDYRSVSDRLRGPSRTSSLVVSDSNWPKDDDDDQEGVEGEDVECIGNGGRSGGMLCMKGSRKQGQGWSGKWNRDDMQDVIAQLRALR